jgi:hypothetical protein
MFILGHKMDYKKLRSIDVSPFIKQKGKFNYISWANSLDILLQHDPMATWEFHDVIYYAETAMVGVTLKAFGKSIQMQLPVLTKNNTPVKNPNSFDINSGQMRCLAKAISAGTGIGLVHLYANDDLPPDADDIQDWLDAMKLCATLDELQRVYAQAFTATKKDKEANKLLTKAKDERKAELNVNN